MTSARSNPPSVRLSGGMQIHAVDESQVLDHVLDALEQGRGGWLLTANLDFVRRYALNPTVRALYDEADLTIADGMPLVWASKIQGQALPERIAGSTLSLRLAERAAGARRSIYLLGGEGDIAPRAAASLEKRYPGLRIAGYHSPWVAAEPLKHEVEDIVQRLQASPPDILYVALGSPKQEFLIRALRPHFPKVWMIGVGISLAFIAGDLSRAPQWAQRSGLEWLHRLSQDPRRLARRYLVENLPFSARLLAGSAALRAKRWLGTTSSPSD